MIIYIFCVQTYKYPIGSGTIKFSLSLTVFLSIPSKMPNLKVYKLKYILYFLHHLMVNISPLVFKLSRNQPTGQLI